MERAEDAEGAAWLQWRKVARKEHLKLEVMQKVLELVVHERMSQGKRANSLKEKKHVPGWSIEEMKEKPNVAVVEDTEEMMKWTGLSEMDLCWKDLAERVEEEEKKVEERPSEVGVPPWNGEGCVKQETQNKKV